MRKLLVFGIICMILMFSACQKQPAEPLITEGQSQISRDTLPIISTAVQTTQNNQTAQPVIAPTISSSKANTSSTQPTITSKPTAAASSTVRQVVTISIPEGFTFYQVARRLEANGICSAAEFYTAAQSYQTQSFQTPYSAQSCYHLEGFLYPDTYEFYKNDDPVNVLKKLLNNYKEKSGLPNYDTLILASIIQRETRSAQHMAMVSSVYHNRLRQGMRLQADATRAYVEQHIKPSPFVQNPEQYAERYNTYKCAALPAGPICSPGRQAIQAAQNPSQSDYLYYFFGSDNTNHYSQSYEQHQAAMAQYGVQYD